MSAAALACGALAAAAQEPPRAAESAAPTTRPTATAAAPATGPTTIPYVDSAFGFELDLPAGWEYDRSRFRQYADSIGLLRGRGPGGQRGLQIQIFRVAPRVQPPTDTQPASVEMPAFEDWIVEFGKALAESASAEKLDWETWSLPPRVGALLVYDAKIAATVTRTFTLCIPLDPETIWIFVYTGTSDTDDDARRLRADFEQVAKSLKVRYDPLEKRELLAAFERGRGIIERVRRQGAQARIDADEEYYEMLLGGKPIGYLRRRFSRESHEFTGRGAKFRDVRDGLRVRERSWRFAEDGTIRSTRVDMFSTFDGQDELIENQTVQFPAPDVQPQQPLIKTDQVIRKKDVLFASLTTNLDRTLPEPGKPLQVGPVYLDLAWMRLSPGLLLTAPPDPHAFATYDTDTRALLSQVITPLGPRPLEGEEGPVYAFEIREGLSAQPSLLYTDGGGKLLRLTAGELVVRRARKGQIEKTYGARREEALERFNLRED